MFTIGIAGGTGSGKSTVVRKILDKIPRDRVALVPQDSYYRDSSHLPMEERQKINFDHPDSLEFDLLTEHIRMLKAGKSVNQPIYSYLTCTRSKEFIPVEPREVIILEGILIYTHMPLVCEPSKRYADIIVPQGGMNEVAISILLNTIEKKLSI